MSDYRIEEPVVDEDGYERHPAYGIVGLSHISSSGRSRMFGSPLDAHPNTIQLTVRRAHVRHDRSGDQIGADSRMPIVELRLSAHQFAELLTTMNIGDGVPCTLEYVENEAHEPLPGIGDSAPTEAASIRDGMEKKTRKLRDAVRAARSVVKGVKMTKADAARLDEALGRLEMEVESNIPYILECFHEAAQKVVVAAKAEVDAFVAGMVQRTGLAALKGGVQVRLPELPAAAEGEQ